MSFDTPSFTFLWHPPLHRSNILPYSPTCLLLLNSPKSPLTNKNTSACFELSSFSIIFAL